MHVVQANLLPVPEGRAHADILEQWHSLVDIAEIAAGSGVRVTVVQAAARDQSMMRNGIEYRFVDVAGLSSPARRSRRIADELTTIGADCLHVHGLAFAADVLALCRRLPGLPILCQDHADRPPRWSRWLSWRRCYAEIPAVSFTAAGLARPFRNAGVFGRQLEVFAIPESSSRFRPGDRGQARALTGLHGDPCVLWIGHLDPGKDPLAVIDGVAAAASRLPGLQLWMVFGTSALLEQVQDRIRAYPHLAGRVHLPGKVPHARVETLLQAADVFVSGSHSESCGYALLEAMACDTMPVVTDIAAFRALAGDGTVGRLWPCGRPARLAEALVDAWTRRAPPGRVRAHFDAELSFAAVGRLWARAYQRLAAGGARSTR